jgi:hypothetical protein
MEIPSTHRREPPTSCGNAVQGPNSTASPGPHPSHSTAIEKHHRRAVQMRQWAAVGRQEERAKRAATRHAAEQRARQHQAALQRLQHENELEKARCQLCDMVRAQAWGLGHKTWAARCCARCWAATAELQAITHLMQQRGGGYGTLGHQKVAISRSIAATEQGRGLLSATHNVRTCSDSGAADASQSLITPALRPSTSPAILWGPGRRRSPPMASSQSQHGRAAAGGPASATGANNLCRAVRTRDTSKLLSALGHR